MRIPACILSAFAALACLAPAPAAAQQVAASSAAGRDAPAGYMMVKVKSRVTRFVVRPADKVNKVAIAAYGPFRVLANGRAALVGITDSNAPAQFAAMLAAHPEIHTLEFVDCPGTYDDRANLRLGRMIREHAIAAVVPQGGSVRSGAVELFLAGATRQIDDGAEFAVHAWLDDWGRSASDYAADSPEHLKYLSYYRDMGMNEAEARAFYAMTNSAPFEHARWLNGAEMRHWIAADGPAEVPAVAQDTDSPQIAVLPEVAYTSVL